MSPMLEAVANNQETLRIVNNFWNKARRDCQPWHSQISKWRRLYDLNHYSTTPKAGEDRYADPTYTNVVDLAVGVVLANDIEWRAYGFSPTAEEEQDTSHIEKFLAGLWEINDIREGSYQRYDLVQHFMRDGCGVIYCVWDDELAKQHMQIMPQPDPANPMGVSIIPVYDEAPIRVQVIDPLKVYLIPGGSRRWVMAGKVEEVTVYDAEATYGVKFPKYAHMSLFQKTQTRGKLIDFWQVAEQDMPLVPELGMQSETSLSGMATPTIEPELGTTKRTVIQHALTFEDQIIWPLHNTGYKDLPYSVGFFKPVSKDNPKDWGHNIMRPMETTIEHLEKMTNRRTRLINTYSALPLTVQQIASRPPIQVDAIFGNVLELQQGERIEFPQWPGSPPDVDRQIDFMMRRAQQSGFSDVAFGQGASQVAGYALSQMADTNRIRLEQPVKHLEFLLGTWAAKALSIAATYGADSVVRVYGQLKGKDFADQVFAPRLAEYKVKAMIKPEFPNEKVRNHAMGGQVAGVLSETTRMERYYDIDQPDDEIKRRLRDAARNHPAMIQYGITNMLMEMAQAGDEAAAITLQQMLMGGMGGGGGGPAAPSPEQPMGGPGPTGEPTPQERGGEPPGQNVNDQMGSIINAAPGMM